MTSTRLKSDDKKSYRKSFTVQIDLRDCDDEQIKEIIDYLNGFYKMNSWAIELAEIIKNE